MGLRPTQGDEQRLLSSNRSLWKRSPPLCHPERSRGICSSADLYWKCFPTERTRISRFCEGWDSTLTDRSELLVYQLADGMQQELMAFLDARG